MRNYLRALSDGAELAGADALALMRAVLDGAFGPEQVAGLLVAYRMRLPTRAELAGFREALLERATLVDLDADDAIDMVGTGGDGMDTFNITTLSALTVAAAGYRVVKHGNGSSTSKHGSSDTLRAAGFTFRQRADDLRRQLASANVTFLHAPFFHPSLKAVAPVRRALGVSTLFNTLGPLVNPARPGYAYLGVADARTQDTYAALAGDHAAGVTVVHSNDGYDEATLTGPVRCVGTRGHTTLQARDFGLPPTTRSAITVADDFAGQFHRILRGEGTDAETHTVAANAGLAIHTRTGDPLRDCVTRALGVLHSGGVAANFEKLCAA